MLAADIPKINTALAEWLACLTFVLVLKKRWPPGKTIAILIFFLPVFLALQYYIGVWPVTFWIPAMVMAMLLMLFCIWACCDIRLEEAVFCFVVAFMSAEFAASLEWQICSYFIERGINTLFMQILFIILFYGIMFTGIYFFERSFFSRGSRIVISWKETGSSILMMWAVFLLSNISYVYPNTPFSTSLPGGVFYIRTLVDFCGLLIFFIQQYRWREMGMAKEMTYMNMILHRQYEQYQLSKENIEMVNHKYHDLKHQIAVIRSESNLEKREQYLAELEADIRMYEAQNKTGNSVLDTILTGKHRYCVQHEINFTCVADGKLLDVMNVMDICTIFGNALDNAIEGVEKLSDVKKRLIRIAVYSQDQFLIIRFENYYEAALITYDNLPLTTKNDKEYHGYGLKSIRCTAEKYGGSMTVRTEDNWFHLRILIPLN